MHQYLQDTQLKLDELPPKPREDARSELQHLLQKVANELDDKVNCKTLDGRQIFQKTKRIFKGFASAVIDSMPSFEVREVIISALGCGDGLEDLEDQNDSEDPENTEDTAESKDLENTKDTEDSKDPENTEDTKDSEDASTLSLKDVKKLRARHLGRELPTFSPYSAVEELIEMHKGRWGGISLKCLGNVMKELTELMVDSVERHFGQFPVARAQIRALISALLESKAESCKNLLIGLVNTEKANTFTMNTHYFVDSKTAFMTRLKEAYLGVYKYRQAGMLTKSTYKAVETDYAADETAVLGHIQKLGIPCTNLNRLYRSQATPVDDELSMMAATLAYFKVAFKRVVDEVPLHIMSFLMQSFASRDNLPAYMYDEILKNGRSGYDG
eukprot:gene7077-173_t